MTTDIVSNSQSPFDSIRRIDEDSNEYWLARELMVLMGYAKWQFFGNAITRAIKSCKNSGNPSHKHFLLTSVKSSGRPAEDYRLSRFGCYLAAMNCDPDKPEVAAAQSYFTVKTREAEVAQQQPKTALQLAKEQVIILERLDRLEKENQRQAEVIDELFNFSSILRVAIYNKIPETTFNYHPLKQKSLELGLEVKSVPCPRFVKKNLYHHDAWRAVYPSVALPEVTAIQDGVQQ